MYDSGMSESKPHSELIAQFERELIAARIDNARLVEQLEAQRGALERIAAFEGVSDWNGWRNFAAVRDMAEDALRDVNPASGERVATGEPSRTPSQGANQSPEESSPAKGPS